MLGTAAPDDSDGAPLRLRARVLCSLTHEEFDAIDDDLKEVQERASDAFVDAAGLESDRRYWSVSLAGHMETEPTFWTHALLTFDGELMSLYVNGSHVATTCVPGPLAFSDRLPYFVAGAAGVSDDGNASLVPSSFAALRAEVKRIDFFAESFDEAGAANLSAAHLSFDRFDDAAPPSDELSPSSADSELMRSQAPLSGTVEEPESTSTALVIAIICIGVIVCLLCIALVYVLRRKRKEQTHVQAYLETRQGLANENESMASAPSRQVSKDGNLAPLPPPIASGAGAGAGGQYDAGTFPLTIFVCIVLIVNVNISSNQHQLSNAWWSRSASSTSRDVSSRAQSH